ncbi:hypothetical protein RAN3_0672 [plant metagenome]|uniref:Uncharacterized protein n=1 Tax=plant metagenome TaxID=1297885 RepID=A0A484V7T3_9ZZZZ
MLAATERLRHAAGQTEGEEQYGGNARGARQLQRGSGGRGGRMQSWRRQ